MMFRMLIVCTLGVSLVTAKGCEPVPKNKCGTDWYDSCLKCGTKSDYDCELCCPNCKLVSKDQYSYCECSKGPTPAPGPSPDTWENYEVAGMNVLSVIGGHDKTAYSKVVIMLHGGGGSGSDWRYQYQQGWLGDLTGMKFVFPTSHRQDHTWYQDFKISGCGLLDDCSYNISTIEDSASRVAELINHEMKAASIAGNTSKVFLAGFSEGAQLTSYIQIAKLNFALGGTIVMDGFALPPLCDMPKYSPEHAKAVSSYYGNDMRWMIYQGGSDPIFPAKLTMDTYTTIFDKLGASSTLEIFHTEPGMSHTLIEKEFNQMIDFIGN